MEALIQGLVERTASLLPFSSKNTASFSTSTGKLGDLRQNAASLIKLSRYRLDVVIEGLLHLYSTLLKSYQSYVSNTSAENAGLQAQQGARANANASMDGLPADERDLAYERFVRSKLIVFQIFSKTLSAAINDDKLDLRFDDDFLAEADELYNREEEEKEQEEKEKKQQEEREAQIKQEQAQQQASGEGGATSSGADTPRTPSTPASSDDLTEPPVQKLPQLEYNLSLTLLKYICETLWPKEPVGAKPGTVKPPPQSLKYLAARVLFKLSVVNFDVVFAKIDSFFRSMKPDEVDPSMYNMIEYVNFDYWRLSRLISLLNDAAPKFKKNAFTAIAQPLRQAIWNWIHNYPHQFIKLCRTKASLPGNPMMLFEFMSALTEKKPKHASMWPVQNMLLLLCPEILGSVIMAVKQGVKNEVRKKQRKFLENLMSTLRGKDKVLSDVALICFVDLYKASTYLSKSDLSALRFLVSEVQNDIQERLMNVELKSSDKNEIKVTTRLMVDFLVSAYRINQRHVTSYIFPLCLRNSALYKLVMTKAMLKLAQEGASLPWHPTLSESYLFLAKPVRLLFQDLLQEERALQTAQKAPEKKPGTSTKSTTAPSTPEPSPYCTETLLNLLAVFYTDPKLVLFNTSGNAGGHINDILYLFGGLCNCLGDFNNAQIQNQAYRLLQKLFDIKYIEKWCPQDVSTGFIELSSSVLTHISCMLVADKDLQGQNIKTLLDLGKELTSSANRYISMHKDQITQEHLKSRKRVQSLENAESALLVLLCSPESEIWATAASCFGDLCDQIDILGEIEVKQNSIYLNYNLYRRISQLIEDGKGRSAQQKNIRRLLRRVELQTKANLSAFIEVYSRWKTYTNALLQNAATKPELAGSAGSASGSNLASGSTSTSVSGANSSAQAPQTTHHAHHSRLVNQMNEMNESGFGRMKTTWKNYTAFLCSMGGVCLQSGEGVFAGSKKKDQNRLTDDLVKDLMRMVGSPFQFVRDGATQTIGSDLSPALYGILFQHLHSTVSAFFGEEGNVKITESSTQFIDQAIYIVKSIIEQAQENADDLSLANFESLISMFVKYCSQLVQGGETVKIRIKLCILLETMIHKKEFITFRDEIEFRFTSLKQIVEWTTDFEGAMKAYNAGISADDKLSSSESAVQSTDASLYKDLDVLCLRAIAALLKDLALDKTKRSGSAKEKEDAVKKDFLKYFTFLSRYLQKSKTDKDAHPHLREFTILSLGNLLESNINYGLEQFLKMAYIEDQETRSAFLAVLTKIMKQGITLDHEEKQEHKKYDRLYEFLTKSTKDSELQNMDIIFQLLSCVSNQEQDALCKALVKLLVEKNKALGLIKAAIDKEISATVSAGTLFRANSFASKMLTAFCQYVGNSYMLQTLSGPIQELSNSETKFEVDPNRVKPGQDVEKGIEALNKFSQQFLDTIAQSVENCPNPIRELCKYLFKKTDEKFSNEPQPAGETEEDDVQHTPGHLGIGGLMFLRFLNPVIVAPHIYGILSEQPSPDMYRCLILVTKVLQNVANGVKFGKKEAFMKPLDSFVMKNLEATREFYDLLINIPEQEQISDDEVILMDEEGREENLVIVHRALFEYFDKISANMTSGSASASSNNLKALSTPVQQTSATTAAPAKSIAKVVRNERVETLQNILSDLGKPPEQQSGLKDKEQKDKEFVSILFTDFIGRIKEEIDAKKFDMATIESKQIFYKGGNSKAGRPVLYFIARHFGDLNIDADIVLYHVLVTLRSVFTKPYEILFDCTELTAEHGIRPVLFSKLHRLLPAGARKNLARLIIYNPNSYLKESVKNIGKVVSRKNIKKLSFLGSFRELTELIDEKSIDLPATTTQFEKDVQNTISPAWVVGAQGTVKECVIKISTKKICVITKKDQILGVDAKRVDFVELGTIDKVKIEKNPVVQTLEQVTIIYHPEREVTAKEMSFKAEINTQLEQAINTAKTRLLKEFSLAAGIQKASTTESIRQSDIPGSVLNMCFLNLESKFPKTRSAAYNLLAALAEQFDFPVTLLETQHMCVPHNTGDLVVALSEEVAGAKQNLTPQFLRESLRGFNKVSLPYKYLCLKYMRPWIKNLSGVYKEAQEDVEQTKKIKEWFTELIKSTIEFKDIYPAMLSELWGEISRDPSLVALSMECLLKEADETGLDNIKADILNDLVVTLASYKSSDLVVQMIVDKCNHVLDEEVKNVEQPLEKNPPWVKVITHCRFLLMLAFQDRVNVVENLPIVFHLITLMIGRGSTYVRATIHALTLNTIHSLATVLKFEKEDKKTMLGYLARLTTNDLKKIFMGNVTVSFDPFVSVVKEKQKLDPVTMWEMETVTHFFLEVMQTCYQAMPELKQKWLPKWMNLCKVDALKLNPILLPRLLTVYGVLVPPEDALNGLSFVLQSLSTSFVDYSPLNGDADLPVAALLCLGQFCLKLSPEEPVLQRMLLIPIILLAASDQTLFSAVVHLLSCMLRAVGKSKIFIITCDSSLEKYFNNYCRDAETDEIVTKLEKITGISFRVSFTFGLSALLMKGLTVTATRERTADICETLVKLGLKQNSSGVSDILGFICGLIPANYNDIITLLQSQSQSESKNSELNEDGPMHVDASSSGATATTSTETKDEVKASEANLLFRQETFANPHSSLLFVRYLLTVVQNMENVYDIENHIMIYNVLQEAFSKIPQVFVPVYSHVMPRVIQVYNQATNAKIAEISLSLINTMISTNPEAAISSEKDGQDALREVQFSGLSRAGAFKAISEKQRTECINLVLEFNDLSVAQLPADVPPQMDEKKAGSKKVQETASAEKKAQDTKKTQPTSSPDTNNEQDLPSESEVTTKETL